MNAHLVKWKFNVNYRACRCKQMSLKNRIVIFTKTFIFFNENPYNKRMSKQSIFGSKYIFFKWTRLLGHKERNHTMGVVCV